MTANALVQAIRRKKPAVIRERGRPRFVVLDWETWHAWDELREDLEDVARLNVALADPRNRRRIPLSQITKRLKAR